MIVQFHPEARREFDEAMDYYEERRHGLGEEFRQDILGLAHDASVSPGRWPMISLNFRRHRSSRFPYCILYKVDGEILYIVSVPHAAQKPFYWRHRT